MTPFRPSRTAAAGGIRQRRRSPPGAHSNDSKDDSSSFSTALTVKQARGVPPPRSFSLGTASDMVPPHALQPEVSTTGRQKREQEVDHFLAPCTQEA